MKIINYSAIILILLIAIIDMFNSGNESWNIILILFSGILGYIVGTMKTFLEEKQKAYGEIIPAILKMAYNPQGETDEKEYCKALSKLWLYGSKEVTRKMEDALKIIHSNSKEGMTQALQEAIIEMRKDIQLFSYQKLKPGDVNHLYTTINRLVINQEEIDALREIKGVIDNIPHNLNEKELVQRLHSDISFRDSLTRRLVRLFGIRNEYTPYLDLEFENLIDKKMEPLYNREVGQCIFNNDKIEEFATFAIEARILVSALEDKYKR